ncbi:hypothetical protein TWF481_000673 [Arthrobotrys musiformis]|uniref:Uncharacterized protein n=1 Tax=Arthrobotrys musiformis TaxID=47236 RepID=A0AAV9WQB6_9PEZI
MARILIISTCAAGFLLLAPAHAARIPFYMVVKAPYYSSISPHNIFTTVPYLVTPKTTLPDPTTNRPSKYFFLKSFPEIDTPTLEESRFWYDTVSRSIYSETAVQAQHSSDGYDGSQFSSPSIEDDLLEGAGGGLVPGTLPSLNLVALEGGDAAAPPPITDLDPDVDIELWELFGLKDGEGGGVLKAADLEVTSSLNSLVAQAYTGDIKLQGKLVGNEGAGQVEGQLWLWRCIFGFDTTMPLGPSIMTQFPDMDPIATAQFFSGIHHVLLVKPKYQDPVTQTPKNWDPLVFDGMNCYRIDPWKNVLAVPANEMEENLQGIKQGTYNYGSRSVQIVNVGGLFPELQEDQLLVSEEEGGSPGEEPGEWTQQLQVPSKPFGSLDSILSEHAKSP